jgi:hypothetical protein
MRIVAAISFCRCFLQGASLHIQSRLLQANPLEEAELVAQPVLASPSQLQQGRRMAQLEGKSLQGV